MDAPNKGTLLLIDDEEAILDVTKMMLESCGYFTLTANNGLTGIELFRAHSKEIKAVLIDLMMPYMNGNEVFRELKKIRGDVKAILISGYSQHEINSKFGKDGFSAFIFKPYNMNDLMTTINEVSAS